MFTAAFNAPPSVAIDVEARSDRPSCFICFPKQAADGPVLAPAAISIGGLDVILLTLLIFADTFSLDKRRLSGSPAWRLLATVGTDFSVDSGLSAAAGILLLRSHVGQKAMPVALCKAICLEASELQCNANVLLAELMRPNAEIENKTLRRLSSNLCDLLVLVGSGTPINCYRAMTFGVM